MMEKIGRPLRVLHAPVNIGNQPWTLSRAERRLGIQSDLIVNYQSWTRYPADKVLGSMGGGTLPQLGRRAAQGLLTPVKYDVLHYYFGRSLMQWDDVPSRNWLPFADLKLARRLGKTVIMTLQGCDARLASESNRRNSYTPCAPGRCGLYENCVSKVDAARLRLIETVLPLCDRVFYLNPELGHYVPNATFLPYANVDIDSLPVQPTVTNRKPVIVHAPTDPSIKGTEAILAALEILKHRYAFELVLVTGKTHDEAMQIYRKADLVIDQVLAGWYGGFAVEVMAMGKPVACSIRESDLEFLPSGMREELPVLCIDPNELVRDIGGLFERQAKWPEIGAASRRFVERWHNPSHIARALEQVYRDPRAPFRLQ